MRVTIEARTAQLQQANENLKIEIIEKHRLQQESDRFFSLTTNIMCTSVRPGYFNRVNRAMMDLLEYAELELNSLPVTHFIHPDDLEALRQMNSQLNSENSVTDFENRYVTKSGKAKWISWTVFAVREDNIFYCAG